MSNAPSTKIVMNEPVDVDCVPPPEGAKQFSHGVGVGVGSTPPCSGGPADANENDAHTSAQVTSNLLMGSSPLLKVVSRGGFTARAPHDTPIDPAIYTRWRTLLAEGRLMDAGDLCRERALVEPDGAARVCHVKDLAIVRRLQGDYEGALDIHVTLNLAAERFTGAFRGRIEHGFARSLQTLGYFDAAFERYTASRLHHEQGHDPLACAQVDTNLGRCYTEARNPSESYFYFDRAEQVAKQFADFHLLGEIAESRALALEAEGRFEEAEESAWLSVQLLTGTNDKTATAESFATWQRVKGKR